VKPTEETPLVIGQTLADGNITMSGENYLSWSGDNNDAYSYIAAELNLTLTMKVNLAIEITDIEGKTIQGEQMLLSKLVGNALFTAEEKDDPIRVYELAKKIYYSDGEIEMTKSDADLIKDKVKAKGFTVLVLAPLFEALSDK
jgi:hypothetical protein